ncbi:hypothetical protein Tco_0731673 [Tanacetum coccineum]
MEMEEIEMKEMVMRTEEEMVIILEFLCMLLEKGFSEFGVGVSLDASQDVEVKVVRDSLEVYLTIFRGIRLDNNERQSVGKQPVFQTFKMFVRQESGKSLYGRNNVKKGMLGLFPTATSEVAHAGSLSVRMWKLYESLVPMYLGMYGYSYSKLLVGNQIRRYCLFYEWEGHDILERLS